jgi:hypothetical protein
MKVAYSSSSVLLLLASGGVATTNAWVVPITGPSSQASSRSMRTTTTTRLNMASTTGGIRSTLGRVRDSILSRERSEEDLKIGIAGFYDRSSKLWEDVWGEVRKNYYYDK